MIIPFTTLLAYSLLVADPGLSAQVASPSCNNQSRTAQITAGVHNQAFATCGVFQFSVGAASFSSPAQCETGSAYYAGTVYSCGPQSTGSDCNSQGYKVTLTLKANGACPSISPLLQAFNGSWYSVISQVPMALWATLSCTPPQVTETFDWSASVSRCTIFDPPVEPTGSTTVELPSGQRYLDTTGDPLAGVDLGQVPLLTSAWSQWELARDFSQLTEPALMAVHQHAGEPAALDVVARCGVKTFSGSQQIYSRSFSFSGVIAASGQIHGRRSAAIQAEGQPGLLVERVAFDGRLLLSRFEGAENGNLWLADSADVAVGRDLVLEKFDELRRWIRDPFLIPAFGASQFLTTSSPTGQRIERVLAGDNPFADWRLQMDSAASPRPIKVELLTPQGFVIRSWTYSNYFEVASGIFRPGKVQNSETHATSSGVPLVVETEWVILSATPCDAPAAISIEPGRWYRWL